MQFGSDRQRHWSAQHIIIRPSPMTISIQNAVHTCANFRGVFCCFFWFCWLLPASWKTSKARKIWITKYFIHHNSMQYQQSGKQVITTMTWWWPVAQQIVEAIFQNMIQAPNFAKILLQYTLATKNSRWSPFLGRRCYSIGGLFRSLCLSVALCIVAKQCKTGL